MEAAELGDRQAWWMYTSVLTFISLGLLSYRKPFAESPARCSTISPDETVILLHPPLHLVGASIGMERGCQQK